MKNDLNNIEKVGLVVKTIGSMLGGFILLCGTFEKFGEKVWDILFPSIEQISIYWWYVIAIIIFIASYNFEKILALSKKKDDTQPSLDVYCGVDKNVLTGISLYGRNSFLINFLQGKGELIYLDIANSPIRKDKDKSVAINTSVILEFYDWETGSPLYKKFFGKWVVPESKNPISPGIDIPSDGIGKRLGVALRKVNDNLTYLLDGSIANFDENGFFIGNLDTLGYCERCVMVVRIIGNNLPQISPLFFEIINTRDNPLEITEMEDGDYWLETAKQSHVDWWTSN